MLREELKDKGFEVITVACDTKGAAAAFPWVEKANPTHPSLLDVHHVVPELYNTKNVPAAFWIDEQGRIVRRNDPIYIQVRNQQTGDARIKTAYLDALRDWVANGASSRFVQSAQTPQAPPTWADAQAIAHFRLGVLLQQAAHNAAAVAQFKQAHALKPDNWNIKCQSFNLANLEADYGFKTNLEAMGAGEDAVFYPPLDITGDPGRSSASFRTPRPAPPPAS